MSELTLLNGLLIKLYTNKNLSIFKSSLIEAKESIDIDISGIYGIIYDDFDIKEEIKKRWLTDYNGIKIFNVARRRKTIRMDSKLAFGKQMKDSIYTPPTYLNYNDIPTTTDSNALFFVKKDGSTGSRHVYISKYNDLSNCISNLDDSSKYMFQESMSNPDLYEGKRYKIRAHVILHNNEVYLHNKTFATVSSEPYNIGEIKDTFFDDINDEDLQKMNVICQANSEKFILYDAIDGYEKIEYNIISALKDFKRCYAKEIKEINETEFSILGFDFVVAGDKSVNIIEINHRSNYKHPEEISNKTDKVCIKDLIKLLLTSNITNTDLYKIE